MVDMIAAGRTAMSHGEAAAVPCRISPRRRSAVTTDAPWAWLGLQAAWVTNGLETARFRAEELDVLRAPAGGRGHGHHDG